MHTQCEFDFLAKMGTNIQNFSIGPYSLESLPSYLILAYISISSLFIHCIRLSILVYYQDFIFPNKKNSEFHQKIVASYL